MGNSTKDWERRSVFRSVYNVNSTDNWRAPRNIQASCKDSLGYVQRLNLLSRLNVHQGCVNSINWNATGDYLLSGSDDQHIAITNPHTRELLLKYRTSHNVNIFSARFMPHTNDCAVVSCSGDGVVLHTEFLAPYAATSLLSNDLAAAAPAASPPYRYENDVKENYFNCHKTGTAYDVMTLPFEPRCFMSCGEDGTVRFYDLRCVSRCSERMCNRNIYIACPSACNAMDLAPINSNIMAVGCSDSIVRLYDRRRLSVIAACDKRLGQVNYQTETLRSYPIPKPERRLYRTTCLKFSPDESELLVSYSSDYLYLYNLKHQGFDAVKLFASGRYLSKMPRNDIDTPGPRLRLRGDWSDTGPNARPEAEGRELGQVRPSLQPNVMGRIADVIARMLSDPNMRSNLFDGIERENVNPPTQAQADAAAMQVNADLAMVGITTSPPAGGGTGTSARQPNSTASRIWRRAFMHTMDSLAEGRSSSQPIGTENSRTQHRSAIEAAAASALRTTAATSSIAANIDADDGADSDKDEDDQSYVRMKFTGHRNSRTMIKSACFWGNEFIMSGSDCGHVFVWERKSGKLVNLIEADRHVVNRVLPHPELPYLASSGIDYDIKLWAPIDGENKFCETEAEALMRRNAVMLQQTMDTITVPAPVMIRLLAGLHSLRNRNRRFLGRRVVGIDDVVMDYEGRNPT